MEESQRREVLAIEAYIQQLGSRQGMERKDARESLVALGRATTGALLGALQSEDSQVRWEAAKALGAIADDRAAPGLVDALRDSDRDVRWLAATALIALGPACLISLFDALCQHPESTRLQERAHHVLKSMPDSHDEVVAPVLQALHDSAPTEILPAVARAAYRRMKREPEQES